MSGQEFLHESYSRIRQAIELKKEKSSSSSQPTVPPREALENARKSLPKAGAPNYLEPADGDEATVSHLINDIIPALSGQALSSRYFGFVTGGVLPVAEVADNVVSAADQNVGVHLPDDTVATDVEATALDMLAVLLGLEEPGKSSGGGGGGPGQQQEQKWTGRTFTTGATASNVLGLASGREHVLATAITGKGRGGGGGGGGGESTGQVGLLAACRAAGVDEIQVLTSGGHSSLAKAASLVGLGRDSVKELCLSSETEPWRLDLDAVERELGRPRVASIISVSAGEVNTGHHAVCGASEMARLRSLADKYGAWLHVDGAFGIFARALPKTTEFSKLQSQLGGIELADSIAADGHKLLNVPYDCGIFFSRHRHLLDRTFANQNAAYLTSSLGAMPSIPSPLNIGIENSRRFRALPVYAALYSMGRTGIENMLARMVLLARKIASFIRASDDYVLLPSQDQSLEDTSIIVLFRARDESLNSVLVQRINESREMYVSGTVWRGKKATRIAVSSWRVDVDRDIKMIESILTAVVVAERRTIAAIAVPAPKA